MLSRDFETCPGCRVKLPKLEIEGNTHPYIGASASCWALFANLWGGGEPTLAPFPMHPLIHDAYCVQHHGTPSPQAIQSVAIHALCLYGVLNRGVEPNRTKWIRDRLLREMKIHRHERYEWLEPPEFEECITIANIVQEPTPERRTEKAQSYIEDVWHLWQKDHADTLSRWYKRYVE